MKFLPDNAGFRGVSETQEFGTIVELDRIESEHGNSRYFFESETQCAFVDIDRAHLRSVSDFLSMKIGRIVYESDHSITIGWYPEDFDQLRGESFYVEDLRFDSEVVWSVAVANCAMLRRFS